MRHSFHTFVQDYAAASGCEVNMQEGDCQAELSLQGISIHAGLLEESSLLICQLPVGIVPDSNREQFFLMLLKANNLLQAAKGFTFGVDDDVVTLQIAWDMTHLSSESFTNLINNLLIVGTDWMVRLDGWQPEEAQNSNEDTLQQAMNNFSGGMNFLKI